MRNQEDLVYRAHLTDVTWRNPILAKEQSPLITGHPDPGLWLSISPEHDSYKFRRRKDLDIGEMLDQRLWAVRKDYSYLRLYYSGGKDSHLALTRMLDLGIFIDEIVVVRIAQEFNSPVMTENDPKVEVDRCTLPALEKLKSKIDRRTRISLINAYPHHYDAAFTDPNWILYTNQWWATVPMYGEIFHKYVNPRFGLLETVNDHVDFYGGIVPDVWWDDRLHKWSFAFVDHNFFEMYHQRSENTLLDFRDPLLTEAWINDLVNGLEARGLRPGRFDGSISYRTLRDMGSIYQFDVQGVQVPKYVDVDKEKVDSHHSWYCQSSKSFFMLKNLMSEKPGEPMLKNYRNADWGRLHRASSGLLTKEWVLE